MADRASESSEASRSRSSVGRGRARARSKSTHRPGGAAESSSGTVTVASGTVSAASGQDSAIGISTDSRPAASRPVVITGAGRGRATTLTTASAPRPGSDTPTPSPSSATSTASKSSGESVELVKRPGFGKSGRAITLKVNCFSVTFKDDMQVYQYRVDISQADGYTKKINREDCFSIFWAAAKANKWVNDPYTVLYDGGGSLFTLAKLNGDFNPNDGHMKLEFDHTLTKSGRKRYLIKITLTGLKKMTFTSGDPKATMLALTVLDLVFRQTVNFPDRPSLFHPFGNSFYYRPPNYDNYCFELDAGREVWSGYYYAASLGVEFKPILNIDVANGVFLKEEPVLQYLCDVLNSMCGRLMYTMDALERMDRPYTLQMVEVETFLRAIKGYFVVSKTTPHRHQRVFGITDQPATTLTFEVRVNREGPTERVTVANYFRDKHNITLRHPYFPCLQVGSRNRPGFLPFELCTIVKGQRARGKLTESQTTTLIKKVCTDAVERERRIMEIIRKAELTQDKFAGKFGVNLSSQMMQVQGRVLPAPQVEYGGNFKINPRDGSWTLTNQIRLYHPAKITSFAIVAFVQRNMEPELAAFCRDLLTLARQMGIDVTTPIPDGIQYVDLSNRKKYKESLDAAIAQCGAKGKECNLIILPTFSKMPDTYAAVKSYCEKEIGIATQFLQQKTIRQAKAQTLSNIVLKINAKLGGINNKLAADQMTSKYLLNQHTLVIGLDVTHPGPSDSKTPSIGAAVGNIDIIPGKFGANVVVQKHRREEVLYLIKVIRERIGAFFKQVGRRPERIIIYRDGVAEGQFEQVLREELKGVKQGLDECDKDYNVKTKITYIVVQKRHHVRFFCADPRDQCGKAKNVPPGTMVDSGITDPVLYDFYLCSHFGIQGTSRPTHYHVLKDDNGFLQEELQAMTYYLCHIYARCPRSVSIPAPVYYAHLACERARIHLHSLTHDDNMSDTSSMTSASSVEATEDDLRKGVIICDNLMSKMYFC